MGSRPGQGDGAILSNYYFLDFTLTTESVMHLSEPVNVGNGQVGLCYLAGTNF
jgi:hypothetical protein